MYAHSRFSSLSPSLSPFVCFRFLSHTVFKHSVLSFGCSENSRFYYHWLSSDARSEQCQRYNIRTSYRFTRCEYVQNKINTTLFSLPLFWCAADAFAIGYTCICAREVDRMPYMCSFARISHHSLRMIRNSLMMAHVYAV